MNRIASTLIACVAMALASSGCGSSSSSTGNSGGSGSSAAAGASSGSTGSGASIGSGVSTGSGASTGSSPTQTTGRLKPTTTPKYGTPPPSAPLNSGLVQVAYRDITIEPDTLRVKVGSTIKWTNHDTIEHNVTSEGGPQAFASKNIGKGGTFEVKLTKPGVIHYECTIHPASMNGTIEVVK